VGREAGITGFGVVAALAGAGALVGVGAPALVGVAALALVGVVALALVGVVNTAVESCRSKSRAKEGGLGPALFYALRGKVLSVFSLTTGNAG